MYSSKGQWFLIASALLIMVLASVFHYRYGAGKRAGYFDENVVEKESFLLSDFLSENFENNASRLEKILIVANDLAIEESAERGFNISLLLFCVFNRSQTLLAFSSFDGANVSVCSKSCLNFSLNENQFFTQDFAAENAVTVFIRLSDGEICANHTFRTDFCAGIFVLSDGKNRYVGRTLNLNSC